jgi:NADPH2:quinone reductase
LAAVRAAVLREYGSPPEAAEFDDPVAGDGQVVVEVTAAGLNPIDLRMASGTLARRPPLPSVAGKEGIGRLPDGRRVYFDEPIPPYGSIAERSLIEAGAGVELPDGVEDAHAVCYGVAGLAGWLSLERRGKLQAGETVLVLGATGVVGLIGVQSARLLGAGRVIAAGRSEEGLRRASELGADATVQLTGSVQDMAAAFREAAEGDLHLVLDPLWGDPAAAAIEALAFGGRLVQMGQSAGGEARLQSAPVRFKELAILGYTNFAAPFEVRAAALRRMWGHVAAGQLTADYETLPLEAIADAWRRQAESPNRKLVIVP